MVRVGCSRAPWEGAFCGGWLSPTCVGERGAWRSFCSLVCVLLNLDEELEASVWLSDKLSLWSWSSNYSLLSAIRSTCPRLPDNFTWVKGQGGFQRHRLGGSGVSGFLPSFILPELSL